MSIEEKKNSQTFQDSEDTFFPKSELEISNNIKNFNEKNIPLEIVGSGSKKFIGKKAILPIINREIPIFSDD